MNSKVAGVVNRFLSLRRENPGDDADLSTQFQLDLVETGMSHELTEDELNEAASAVGIPPHKVNDFKESLASWL